MTPPTDDEISNAPDTIRVGRGWRRRRVKVPETEEEREELEAQLEWEEEEESTHHEV